VTTNYYDKNAESFAKRTIERDVSDAYKKFLNLLPSKGRILDAGCGSGRDARHFKQLGHDAVAFDASIEMVKLSSLEVGHPTLHLNFQDMAFKEEFDGVWACASLLHVPYEQTEEIIHKIKDALKPKGFFYASYKHGDAQETSSDGRIFYNMNETTILPYLDNSFKIIEMWQTPYTSAHAHATSTKSWLNVLCQKMD
jgi:SAM-dependent methyltransferase